MGRSTDDEIEKLLEKVSERRRDKRLIRDGQTPEEKEEESDECKKEEKKAQRKWEVDGIIGKRGEGETIEYYVKWGDSDEGEKYDCTWEPLSSFNHCNLPLLLKEFEHNTAVIDHTTQVVTPTPGPTEVPYVSLPADVTVIHSDPGTQATTETPVQKKSRLYKQYLAGNPHATMAEKNREWERLDLDSFLVEPGSKRSRVSGK